MFLDGAQFVIQTDHQALSWLKRLPNPSGRLARWALTLQRYDYVIEYKKGSTNTVADALSRAPLSIEPQVEPETVCAVATTAVTMQSRWGTLVSKQELLAAQHGDGLCCKVSEKLAARDPTDTGSDEETDCYLLGEGGLLFRYFPQVDDGSVESPFRVVIPRKLRKLFIKYYHDSALAGHSSGQKTYEKLCRTVTWPGLKQDVLRYAPAADPDIPHQSSAKQSQTPPIWIAANEPRADDATRMPGLRPQLLIGQGRSIPAPTHEPAGPVESCGHSTTSPRGPYYRGKPPWGRDVPEPFRGLTLEDRHPNEPGASYTEEERRLLCALCGVPEIHRSTHRASPLHAERAAAERARQHVPNDEEAVTQALLVLRSLRPDLLARPQAIREDDILDIEINDV
ncbi:uncharacterized protein LOC125756610 [Rhipicephalus sanguineus]|uniref:uncharacterized protein LOC125756610 n=1 Tax=Rhipicephalus sanguineus TaxID=34632 RepID=UPI0020C4E902|nr:uncharacterized protein LOC125756610 [Rhipicephalus sanguineus]